MISVENVGVERAGRRLIDGVSIEFPAGQVTAVLGPNGAGKTTLLRAISGEWRVRSGRVRFADRDIGGLAPAEFAALRAVVPQSTSLSFPFTVLGVVMLGVTVPGFGLDVDRRPALQALRDVGLDDYAERLFTQLSGGERQRVHIARALCQLQSAPPTQGMAKALLLDEPTASLDPAHQALVLGMARRQAEQGMIVIAILHDLNLAAAWADTIVLMKNGRIVLRGPPSTVFSDEILSDVYGCEMRANTLPSDGACFVLPHHTRSAPPRRRREAADYISA